MKALLTICLLCLSLGIAFNGPRIAKKAPLGAKTAIDMSWQPEAVSWRNMASSNEANKHSGWRPCTLTQYASKFHGRITASGEQFDHRKLTVASRGMKLGTRVEIRYRQNSGRWAYATVVVNDTGRLKPKQFDVSRAVAQKLGLYRKHDRRYREAQYAVLSIPRTHAIIRQSRQPRECRSGCGRCHLWTTEYPDRRCPVLAYGSACLDN